jgi:CheY-like chemotaxis protein
VLICDDEDVLRTLVRDTLADRPYTVIEARNGDEAVAAVRSARPELVLLDMMMPGRSGLDVLREIRADPELAETPVLMLTARTQVDDYEQASAAGATQFLAKPFSPFQLAVIVDELLGA